MNDMTWEKKNCQKSTQLNPKKTFLKNCLSNQTCFLSNLKGMNIEPKINKIGVYENQTRHNNS